MKGFKKETKRKRIENDSCSLTHSRINACLHPSIVMPHHHLSYRHRRWRVY
jgi:hypothetical protein